MTDCDSNSKIVELDSFEVFPWNKNFETGNPTIDQQHKTLVSLLNRLAKTLINSDYEEVNTAFESLAEYACSHFDDEESIWMEHLNDDGWLSSHQMSHAAFLPKIVEIKDSKDGTSLSVIVEQVIKFLIRWLAFHIIDSDKRLAIAVDAIKNGSSIEDAKKIADRKMSGSMRVLIETILTMYDGLSSRAIELMRERHLRIQTEHKLKQANRLLEELSVRDPLTGLFNRRYFDSISGTEIRKAFRDNRALGFMLIDIDYFKSYNDTYGHLEGDSALQYISGKLVQACRRPGDVLFRFGGEEFGILITDASGYTHDVFAESIRRSIEELRISHKNSPIGQHMTVSIGVVTQVPSKNDTISDFIRAADKRLYRAKSIGRNQVVWQDDLSSLSSSH